MGAIARASKTKRAKPGVIAIIPSICLLAWRIITSQSEVNRNAVETEAFFEPCVLGVTIIVKVDLCVRVFNTLTLNKNPTQGRDSSSEAIFCDVIFVGNPVIFLDPLKLLYCFGSDSFVVRDP